MNMSNISVGMKSVDKNQFSGPPCPGCGEKTIPGKHYCYRCSSFIDPSGTRLLKPEEVTLSQMEEVIACSQQEKQKYERDSTNIKAKKVALFGVAGVFISPLLMLANLFVGFCALAVSLWAIIFYPRHYSKPRPAECLNIFGFEKLINKYLAPQVLKDTLDRLDEFDPDKEIPKEFVDRTGLIREGYNGYGGSGYVRGVYHGIPVEWSNVQMAWLTEDADGKQDRKRVFSGTFLICKLDNPLPADVLILRGNRWKNRIETDHEAFNRRFSAFSGDKNAVFRFLTPRMMEALMGVDESSRGCTGIFAMQDGRIVFACDNGHQLFSFHNADEGLPQIRALMEEEILNVLALADLCARGNG